MLLRIIAAAGLLTVLLNAQSEYGGLRLAVSDAAGAGLDASVELRNEATNLRQTVMLPPTGRYVFKALPLGRYQVTVTRNGFAPAALLVEIRAGVPQSKAIQLNIQALEAHIDVTDSDTLLQPDRAGSSYYVGSQELREQSSAQAQGRALINLVAMQPGWSLEANGVLHPRESEYDTQFVVNGLPQYDNRSPAFAGTVDADDVESVKVMTGGIPAEFGQKLGGVVEVNTRRNTSAGFHGTAVLQGGSFATGGGFFSGQYVAGRTTIAASAQGFLTDRYLDPATTANDSNHASSGSFAGSLEHDFDERNTIRIWATRRTTHFEVPNDLLQQAAGQRQDRASVDTEGAVSYQHVFSPSVLGAMRGMVRDVGATLWSNPFSTPILSNQDRGARDGYINGSLAGQWGRHDWKTGVEVRAAKVRENFGYQIVQYANDDGTAQLFDPGLPQQFKFRGQAWDREQAGYVQDAIRLGSFLVNLGVRIDHYSLLVNRTGWSPRLALAWTHQATGTVLHASYDRTFGTPPFENLLVSAAASAQFGQGLYLPVQPSRGNYYEGGLAQGLGKHVRLDATWFYRDVRNQLDDDVLLNTGISFPITYDRGRVRGTEVKLSIPKWGPLSGYFSYSNSKGTAQYPISGGLFLDSGAAQLLTARGEFPISQDQRNTARALARWQVSKRIWTSWSGVYNSGLPIEGDLPPQSFLASQFGADVVARANQSRGRVRPNFSLDASVGVDVWRHEQRAVTLQADGANLTGRLNVINFAGLLSGTAVAQPRSGGLRLRVDF